MMFGFTAESHAFMEWLYKLSGPGPFIGFRIEGRFALEKSGEGCSRLVDSTFGTPLLRRDKSPSDPALPADPEPPSIPVDPDDPADSSWPKLTVNIGGGGLWSYENNLDYNGTEIPQVSIGTIEGTVEKWFTKDRDLYIGAGYAFNRFMGRHFTDFHNDAAVNLVGKRCKTPLLGLRGAEIGLRGVWFKDRFKPSDFGANGDTEEERFVYGAFMKFKY
jgi:hypothetical protein